MITTFVTPEIAILNDNVYNGIIPLGTPANTNTYITEFSIPSNCIGKIFLIENQTLNTSNIKTYVTVNDMEIPEKYSLGNRDATKENRPYFMNHFISGDEKIRLWVNNLAIIATADLNVYVRLAFWFFDIKHIKNDEYLYNQYQEIIKTYKIHKGITGDEL